MRLWLHALTGTRPGDLTTLRPAGFIAEMRKVAMKLHTKDQAPKEGEKEAPKQGPVRAWSRHGVALLPGTVDDRVSLSFAVDAHSPGLPALPG